MIQSGFLSSSVRRHNRLVAIAICGHLRDLSCLLEDDLLGFIQGILGRDYISTGWLTPIFCTEIGLLDIGRTLCEDQFFVSSTAVLDRLDRDVAIGDKSESTFDLKTSHNHLV